MFSEAEMVSYYLDQYHHAAGCAEGRYPELIDSDPHLSYMINHFYNLNDCIADRLRILLGGERE